MRTEAVANSNRAIATIRYFFLFREKNNFEVNAFKFMVNVFRSLWQTESNRRRLGKCDAKAFNRLRLISKKYHNNNIMDPFNEVPRPETC